MDTTEPIKKIRRTNDEILAKMIAERKEPKKRKRRTKAEIERDRRKEQDAKLKAELAVTEFATVRVISFQSETFVFGKTWLPGDELWLHTDSYYYPLAFDKNNNFILDKTVEQQKKLWGKVKYIVREEQISNGITTT